jgi:pyridoxine kinase
MSAHRASPALAATLREGNPELVYVCDPVLGDAGKLYVPAELVEAYRTGALRSHLPPLPDLL